jgi:hypothetical protein
MLQINKIMPSSHINSICLEIATPEKPVCTTKHLREMHIYASFFWNKYNLIALKFSFYET